MSIEDLESRWQSGPPATYKMRANFSFSRMKASIWMPKITSEETKAVINATKLMPSDPWSSLELPEAVGLGVLLAVADIVD
jgi:hypothetical protein